MTRPAHRSRVRGAPTCTPNILVHAPEMAVVCVLHEASDAACYALFAQHPTLLSEYVTRPEPKTLRAARRLISASTALDRAISSYVTAVRDALQAPADCFDDPPF
jgi:hypothetical protein